MKPSFGERLQAERERAGVSLDTIAEITKIKRSLLVGLENNDLSHWPTGIFRRAFFREYLAAIGVRSEPVVAEFQRLFPESGEATDVPTLGGLDAGEMRLQLAERPDEATRRRWFQTAAAAIDLAVVFVLSAWAIVLLRLPIWPTTAALGFFYYGASVAWIGLTPGLWWFFGDRSAFRRLFAKKQPAAELPPLRIVARQAEESDAPDAETHVA